MKERDTKRALPLAETERQEESLGYGTLASRETKQQIARAHLMSGIAELLPNTLEDLRRSTSQAYEELLDLSSSFYPDQRRTQVPVLVVRLYENKPNGRCLSSRAECVNNWHSLEVVSQHFAPADALRNAIVEWARALQLGVVWFFEATFLNVIGWSASAHRQAAAATTWAMPGTTAKMDSRQWGSGGTKLPRIRDLEEYLAPPPLPPYNPAMQTRIQHREEVLKTLVNYQTEQELLFVRFGFEKTQRKRARVKPPTAGRLIHGVQYQLQGWTTRQILEADPSTEAGEDAVYKAVSSVAEDVGVSLRPRLGVAPSRK